MSLSNILRSGKIFTNEEFVLEIKYRIINSAMLFVMLTFIVISFIHTIQHDIATALIETIAVFISLLAIFLLRAVKKDSYPVVVYLIITFFLAHIFYRYYLHTDVEPVAAWVIVTLLASLIVIDIKLAFLIMGAYISFLLYMHFYVFTTVSLELMFRNIIPVFVGLIVIWIIDKKYHMIIDYLENTQHILEKRANLKAEVRIKTFQDEKQNLEIQLYNDTLTKLPSKHMFVQMMETWLKESKEESSVFSLIILSVDNIVEINDSFGNDFGDKVLSLVSKRINIVTKRVIDSQSKENFIARLGGVEFVILLDGNESEKMLEDLKDVMHEVIMVDTQKVYVNLSMGVSQYPTDGETYDTLLNTSRIAMQYAKNLEGTNYIRYTEEMKYFIEKKNIVDSEVLDAIHNNDLKLYYVPRVDTLTHNIVGVEVILRWRHPELGFVSPQRLIESKSIKLALDYYILEEGMKQVFLWHNQGYKLPLVSFFFSSEHLHGYEFIENMEHLLFSTQCKAEWIELSVGDHENMPSIDRTLEVLRRLKSSGMKIAIDNFGTEYSSFSSLKDFPIDTLKLHPKLLQDIGHSRVDQTIIKSIVSIAQSMDVNVVVKGVTRFEEKEFLKKVGCRQIQGDLYYEAMPKEYFEARILKS